MEAALGAFLIGMLFGVVLGNWKHGWFVKIFDRIRGKK